MSFAAEDLQPFGGYDNLAACVAKRRTDGDTADDALDACILLRDGAIAEERGFNPDQPRDESGRWSEAGGGSALATDLPLASQGQLPGATGAAWGDLSDHESRDYLLDRASRTGKGVDLLISPDAVEEFRAIATDDKYLISEPQKVAFGMPADAVSGDEFTSIGTRYMADNAERAARYGDVVIEAELPAGTRAWSAEVAGLREIGMLPGSKFSLGERSERGGKTYVAARLLDDGTEYTRGLVQFVDDVNERAANFNDGKGWRADTGSTPCASSRQSPFRRWW